MMSHIPTYTFSVENGRVKKKFLDPLYSITKGIEYLDKTNFSKGNVRLGLEKKTNPIMTLGN